jgi:AAA+ ATPase superfamily predicted ATPase
MPKTNPFPTTGYLGPDYFCDREDELKQLKRNLEGGNSTTLIALRRLGKTALIQHLFHHIGKQYTTIYIDILPTESMEQFLNRFIMAVTEAIPEKTSTGKKVWNFIRSLRPVITYDALQAAPVISVKADAVESRRSMSDLFELLESQAKNVLVAIDEFQQILNYPESGTDAWLRSVIQKLNHVHFIFSGSQQHLMQDLFANPARPFFRSTQFIKMGPIRKEVYRDFIVGRFEKENRKISRVVAEEILDWADGHTYYVQLLCNRAFTRANRTIRTEDWRTAAEQLLNEQEFVFYNYREMITKPQWSLLKAIALEGRVYQPTSSAFISRHELGTPATVKRSLVSLEQKELIYHDTDEKGNRFYGVCDLLFRRWVER